MLNTPRSVRWVLWDDKASNCRDGCFMDRHCDRWAAADKAPPRTLPRSLGPCCVKRQSASYPVPCEELPHGCHHLPVTLGATLQLRQREIKVDVNTLGVRDLGVVTVPRVYASHVCPTREDVINTPVAVRWSLWEDHESPACPEGCWLHWSDSNRTAPPCIKRQQARWPRGSRAPLVMGGQPHSGLNGTPVQCSRVTFPDFKRQS